MTIAVRNDLAEGTTGCNFIPSFRSMVQPGARASRFSKRLRRRGAGSSSLPALLSVGVLEANWLHGRDYHLQQMISNQCFWRSFGEIDISCRGSVIASKCSGRYATRRPFSPHSSAGPLPRLRLARMNNTHFGLGSRRDVSASRDWRGNCGARSWSGMSCRTVSKWSRAEYGGMFRAADLSLDKQWQVPRY